MGRMASLPRAAFGLKESPATEAPPRGSLFIPCCRPPVGPTPPELTVDRLHRRAGPPVRRGSGVKRRAASRMPTGAKGFSACAHCDRGRLMIHIKRKVGSECSKAETMKLVRTATLQHHLPITFTHNGGLCTNIYQIIYQLTI